MTVQAGVFPVQSAEYGRVLEVWEASVRATHHFVAESDILFFRTIIPDALSDLELACVRDTAGLVVGFVAVSHHKVDMLFVHPAWRGQGVGGRLLRHAVDALGATSLDVNEQNTQALEFYRHMGFEVAGRSDVDGTGKPYPLLHMRLPTTR